MARVGINPARGKLTNYRPARVTVAVLTYIPSLTGYFADRLDILRIVFSSLQAYTTYPNDLLVFDNGSCKQVVDYLLELQHNGLIDYLFLSQNNIGKIDAFQFIFNAAPGEIIAYCDDDVLFYPTWLEAQLEILNRFPHAGMVSGLPVRDASRHARKSLDAVIEQGVPGLEISWEHRIPDEWEIDWAISTGRDPQLHLQATKDHQDLVLRVSNGSENNGCEAIGSANHFQFIAPKNILLQALPASWTGKLMGSMVELDEAIDNLGYLRLSTTERYARHLGNVLSAETLGEVETLGLSIDLDSLDKPPLSSIRSAREKHWLLRFPGSRRILSAFYNRLFNILYQ